MDTLIKFNEFVKEINLENGRNYKQAVLKKYKDDEDIKYYLDFIFNPYIITGISDKKLNKNVSNCNSAIEWSDCHETKELLEYIKLNNTGKDIDIKTVQEFKKLFILSEYRDLISDIITKDLPLGIDAKTINKVISNLIPTFSVQLAEKYFDKPEKVEGKSFSLTTKIDGGRIIALKENGKVSFFTRKGQAYEGLIDLEEEMKSMPDNLCLDGEITLLNPGELTSKDQYKQTMKITRALGEKHGVKMLVFDCMAAEEFRAQKCDTIYTERRNKLNEIFSANYTYFNLLPVLYSGTDTSEIVKWLSTNIANGEEGVMININDAPYEFDRTWNLIKVKKMQTLDLEIVDYFEGENSFTGMLGGFIVRYRDNNLVRVGSGYSKELREEVWSNPDSYIGKIIEVQYFEETTNDNGGISLRFPVFRDFREDKLEADF